MTQSYLFDGWYGNKKIYLPIIEPMILYASTLEKPPEIKPHNNFIDVFGGGGSVSFLTTLKLTGNIYNDLDYNLVNFFKVIKHSLDEFVDRLEYQLCDIEELTEMHRRIRANDCFDNVDRAICFYLIWRQSFLKMGIQRQSFQLNNNSSRKKSSTIITQAKQLYTRLEGFIIEHLDYKELLQKYNQETNVFFLDPPYDAAQGMYLDGKGGFNHEELRGALQEQKGKWILMYNDNTYIHNLYKDCCINSVSRHSNATRNQYYELIITNFEYKVKNELF